LKKKRRMDEPSKKKKRRVYFDEEESSDELELEELDVEEELHELITRALEDEDWAVSDLISLLADQMKYIVREYE
jgi:ribosome-binding protein aMBF1 (putative translation factor)